MRLLLLFLTILTFTFGANARMAPVSFAPIDDNGTVDKVLDPIDDYRPNCSTQPSTLNVKISQAEYWYSAGSCMIKNLPKSCNTGYTLQNSSTPSARCSKNKVLPMLCLAGKYSSGSSCLSCAAGTYSAAGSTSCTTCPLGKVSLAGSSSCSTIQCGAGKFLKGSACLPCAAGKYSTATSNVCTACPTGKTSVTGASACASIACTTGKYLSGSSCLTCATGTKVNAAKTGCEKSMCAKQPNQANVTGTTANVYYSAGKCWIGKAPNNCTTGYGLELFNNPLSYCKKFANCTTQPSTANTTTTSSNFWYSGQNCWIPTLPTACKAGYTLLNAGTYNARCNKNANCPNQPALGNSTANISNFYTGSCWLTKVPTKCALGYTLKDANTEKARCAMDKMCATQPHSRGIAAREGKYDTVGKCWLDLPTKCDKYYTLENAGTTKANCLHTPDCQVISTNNASKTSDVDVLVSYKTGDKKCWIRHAYATACKTGYVLQNVGNPYQGCGLAPDCTTQPTAANATTTSATRFFSATDKCYVKTKHATACITGYTLKDANTAKVRCEKLPNCSPQPSTTNSTKSESNVYYAAKKCWFAKMPTACTTGYALKDATTDKARCDKIPNCATQPSVTNSTKTAANVYYAAKSCLVTKMPTECTIGHTLEDKDTDKANCEKAPDCRTKPSVKNSSAKETNVFYEKGKCFLPEVPTKCNADYGLKYERTDKARCEKVKKCRKASSKNVKKFKDNFFYEKKKCIVEKLPIECDSNYILKYPETDRTTCSKESKGSRR